MQHKERRDLPVKGPPLPPAGTRNETAVAIATKLQLLSFCAWRRREEGRPRRGFPRPRSLGWTWEGTRQESARPRPNLFIQGPEAPQSRGGSPTLTACPFLSPNPLKQTSIVQEGISRRSWLLPTRFPWASVDGVKPGLQPALSPRPPHPGEGAPLCCFISSPPPHLFLLLGCSPRPAA